MVLAQGHFQPLSLILHELATNAIKHGALSMPNGQVRVHWTLEADPTPRLRLGWQEAGGPSAPPPTATGFGTRLIQVAAAELGGYPELDYGPAGLKAEIIVFLTPSSEG